MNVDKWTDKQLEQLESRIKTEYRQAGNDLKERYDNYINGWDEEKDGKTIHHKSLQERYDEQYKAFEKGAYKDPTGRYTDEEMFNRWLVAQEGRGDHIANLIDQMDERLLNAGTIARDYTNGILPKVYTNNNNAVADLATASAMEQGIVGVRFDLVDEYAVKRLMEGSDKIKPYKAIVLDLPKMSKYNKTKLQNCILEGILTGASIDRISKKLEGVVGMNRAAAVRNARTAVTGAQAGGKQDRYEDLADKGCITTKIWIATADERTREEHAEADGQEVDYNEPFEVGGEELMFPADTSLGASDWNIYNCRCSTKVGSFKFSSVLSDTAKQIDSINILGENDNNIKLSDIGDKPQRPRRSEYEDMDLFEADRERYKQEKEAYEQRLDAYVKSELEKERKYDTIDSVKKWCEDNNYRIDNSVLEHIDLRIMDDVIAVHEEMNTKYPFIKEAQDKYYPYGFGYEKDRDYTFEASRGLNFGFMWENYEEALKGSIDSLHDGYLTTGDGTIRTIIRHEFGHNIDDYISMEKFATLNLRGDDPEVQRRYNARREYEKELIQITEKYCKTEYGHTNTLEAFAEGFAEYSSNSNSEYGKVFGEFVNKWLEWN